MSYRLIGGMRLTFDVGYHKLASQIAASPIVQVAGKRDQLSGGVGVNYRFGVGH